MTSKIPDGSIQPPSNQPVAPKIDKKEAAEKASQPAPLPKETSYLSKYETEGTVSREALKNTIKQHQHLWSFASFFIKSTEGGRQFVQKLNEEIAADAKGKPEVQTAPTKEVVLPKYEEANVSAVQINKIFDQIHFKSKGDFFEDTVKETIKSLLLAGMTEEGIKKNLEAQGIKFKESPELEDKISYLLIYAKPGKEEELRELIIAKKDLKYSDGSLKSFDILQMADKQGLVFDSEARELIGEPNVSKMASEKIELLKEIIPKLDEEDRVRNTRKVINLIKGTDNKQEVLRLCMEEGYLKDELQEGLDDNDKPSIKQMRNEGMSDDQVRMMREFLPKLTEDIGMRNKAKWIIMESFRDNLNNQSQIEEALKKAETNELESFFKEEGAKGPSGLHIMTKGGNEQAFDIPTKPETPAEKKIRSEKTTIRGTDIPRARSPSLDDSE